MMPGKRIKGRKRHIVTDTVGFLVGLVVHGADVQAMRLTGWSMGCGTGCRLARMRVCGGSRRLSAYRPLTGICSSGISMPGIRRG